MNQKFLPVIGVVVFLFLSGTVSGLSSIEVNIRSGLLVFIGTLICGLISYSGKTIIELIKNIRFIFTKQDDGDYNALINIIENLAKIRRSKGIKALEAEAAKTDNLFLQQGIEMVVDGYERSVIFNTLEKRYENFLAFRQSQSDVINTLVKLSPVFGFVGTILGLINVLNNMGSPEVIGKGMATALLTTFYGLLFANMFFLPIAKKISTHTKHEAIKRSLVIEGILDITDNVNSKSISYRLHASLGSYYNESMQKESIQKEKKRSIQKEKTPIIQPVPLKVKL